METIFFPCKNGTATFESRLEPILTHTFQGLDPCLQGFLSQDTELGAKQFATVHNLPQFVQNIAGKDYHLYEIVPITRPVRPYVDLEWDEGQLPIIETLEIVLQIIAYALEKLGVRGSGLSIYDASGPCTKMPSGRKASFHILCNTDRVFRTTSDHKLFIDHMLSTITSHDPHQITWEYNGTKKCVIDHIPYMTNQAFRLPYQSKMGSGRRLLPFDLSQIECIEANITTIGIYHKTTDFIDVSSIKHRCIARISNAIVKESPEYNKVIALAALLTPTQLYEYRIALGLIFCLWGIEQSPRMQEYIHSTLQKASNYEHKWVQNIITTWKYSAFSIGSLIAWVIAGGHGKDKIRQILQEHKTTYCDELFTINKRITHHTQIHQRYLGIIAFSQSTLIIKSHLGTGKTVSITNLIRASAYKRILIISPRKSYTYAQHGIFTADSTLPPMKSYLDLHGNISDEPFLIIQVESLHRLQTVRAYDLVILDESESILNQMHSVTTHAGNMIANHEILGRVISDAHHVIFSDAFISDRTCNISALLRNDVHYIENTYQPYKRDAIMLTPSCKDKRVANIGGFVERIMTVLAANKRVVVIWTSKRRGEWFVKEYLATSAYRWIFYNSDSTKEEHATLRNVNVAWATMQCLMMTTSITVGISYDNVPFDEAFLYGTSASAIPRDIAQALLRVRLLTANKLTYVLDTRSAAASQCGFNMVSAELAAKEGALIKNHPLVNWTTCPEWVRYNHTYNENEMRISCAEYTAVLQRYLVECGYTLCESVHLSDIAAYNVEEGIYWDQIADIRGNVNEIIGAIKCGEASAEIVLMYKKYLFKQQFATDDEDLLSMWWKRFYETGKERAFWNVVHEKRCSISQIAAQEAMKRYGIMAFTSVQEREALDTFLGIIGMHHSQEEIVLDMDALLRIQLKDREKELRDGFGLRASRRKGNWDVSNTIDLIRNILEAWGCCSVETVVKRRKIQGKTVRTYSLIINKNNVFWDNIYKSDINYDDFLIEF